MSEREFETSGYVICPGCGSYLVRWDGYQSCERDGCEEQGKRYELTKVTLRRVDDDGSSACVEYVPRADATTAGTIGIEQLLRLELREIDRFLDETEALPAWLKRRDEIVEFLRSPYSVLAPNCEEFMFRG